MPKFFLEKEILKLQKKCEVNKKEMCLFIELITYLTATKELTLDEASELLNKI